MKKDLPVVVHGDGTSIWTLTHHKDFAVGLVGLLGNSAAIKFSESGLWGRASTARSVQYARNYRTVIKHLWEP